jgi:hypothetical protein
VLLLAFFVPFGARRLQQALHPPSQLRLSRALEGGLRLRELAKALEREAVIAPGTHVLRLTLDDVFQHVAGLMLLARFQITQRKIHLGRDLVGQASDQIFVDLDGTRVHAEPEVHDPE